MVLLTQVIQQQMVVMLSCSHHKHIHFRITQHLMYKLSLLLNWLLKDNMQVDTHLYWNQHPQQNIITVPTHTILHTRLEVNYIINFHDITKSLYNRTQANKSVSINPICLTDYDYDYILEAFLVGEK